MLERGTKQFLLVPALRMRSVGNDGRFKNGNALIFKHLNGN